MPQIYYGFKNDYAPFYDVLNNWIYLCENKSIKMVPVLAYYKINELDNEAGSGKREWIEDKEIIDKQISLIKHNSLYGYAFFRYDFMTKT